MAEENCKLPDSEEKREEDMKPEPEKTAESDKAAKPEPESEKTAEPESVNTAEPDKVAKPEPEPESDKAPEPKPEPESVKAAELEPESDKSAEPKPEPESVKAGELEPEPVCDKSAEPKPAELEPEPESEKAAEPKKPAAEELEKPVEKEGGKLAESLPSVEKPTQPLAEKLPEAIENIGASALEQEEAGAPSTDPGSLSFPFLEDKSTETALRGSQTLYILLGLPGAGKTYLASAIRDHYRNLCTVISADEHGVKPEHYETSADGHKALDAAVASCCSSGKAVVVVDDTNHTSERLTRLGELAEEHRYFALFLEPRTSWCRDVELLPGKTGRGLDKGQIQALKGSLEAACYPLYFGWFLQYTFMDALKDLANDFLKILDSMEAFKEHLSDFSVGGEEVVNLEQYYQHTSPLHCTTKFCDYGKAEGAKEYMESQVVQQKYGSITELELPALFLTPRTFGARVALTPEQLLLWPSDTEGEGGSALPPGSRAHITLGCARGVEPVQTGLDLLQILQLQKDGKEGEKVADLGSGTLRYYGTGTGTWLLSLTEPGVGPALFSSSYGRKIQEVKRRKCTIL
ncbi:hypothetical protein GJAV_G00219010 [Gymnothorax javanicus]|nr:hypothetical protein GJAV_G00219010 [Gymnothorax javanicus]